MSCETREGNTVEENSFFQINRERNRNSTSPRTSFISPAFAAKSLLLEQQQPPASVFAGVRGHRGGCLSLCPQKGREGKLCAVKPPRWCFGLALTFWSEDTWGRRRILVWELVQMFHRFLEPWATSLKSYSQPAVTACTTLLISLIFQTQIHLRTAIHRSYGDF